jgi:hypothetical protein
MFRDVRSGDEPDARFVNVRPDFPRPPPAKSTAPPHQNFGRGNRFLTGRLHHAGRGVMAIPRGQLRQVKFSYPGAREAPGGRSLAEDRSAPMTMRIRSRPDGSVVNASLSSL